MTDVDHELEQAASAIADASSVALACHVDPDGDALGALLGLFHLCRAVGKPAVASWPEPFVVARHYRFLPGIESATKPADFPPEPEVMITFDCGSMARLNELGKPAKAAGELVVVDHHRTNDRYGTINVIDPDAAASVVLVRRLAATLGWPRTRA